MISFLDGVVDELGSADILIANAGVSTLGSIFDLDAEGWAETVDVNLTGVFNAMRAAAPHMRRARWGRIVAISSMMGRSANPLIPAYCASKWGVIGLTKSVAHEMAHFGVTANVVAPGNVSTGMIHNDMLYRLMRPDLERPTADDVAGPMAALHVQPVPWLEADEITAAVVYLCSEGARHVTGLGDRRRCRRVGAVHRLNDADTVTAGPSPPADRPRRSPSGPDPCARRRSRPGAASPRTGRGPGSAR